MNHTKYLLPAGLIVLIGFCGYFYTAISSFSEVLLQEKISSCKNYLDGTCNSLDRMVREHDNWDCDKYVEALSYIATEMDDWNGVYAELFDKEFNGLSERVRFFQSNPFDPRNYPDLVERLKTEERGDYVAVYKSDETPVHDIHVLWRWIPTGTDYDNRLLFVVGVSEYEYFSSLKFYSWLIYGDAALIVFLTVVLISVLMFIKTRR